MVIKPTKAIMLKNLKKKKRADSSNHGFDLGVVKKLGHTLENPNDPILFTYIFSGACSIIFRVKLDITQL